MTAIVRPASREASSVMRVLAPLAVVLFVVAMVALAWTGYTESDDWFYARAAAGWAFHFPYLAHDHWGLRHAVVLPMALMFRLFGESELTLESPALFYLAALLLLCFFYTRRIAGSSAALLAVVLIMATPGIAARASALTEDLAEACFVLGSLFAFQFAWDGRRVGLFVLSGVLAGLGFITRETTVALLAAYGVLFLLNYGGRRLPYVWMGIGFALVVGLDTALLWWASGDPLYRLHISLAGVHGDNSSMAGQFQTEPGLTRFGNIAVARWLEPLAILFVDQRFGLLFWAAVPACAVLAFDRTPSETRRGVRLIGTFALVWFVVLCYLLTFLWVLARYQLIVSAAMAIPLAIALDRLFRRGRWVVAGGAVALLIASGLALISASNRNPLFGERALVAYARQHDAVVDTDPGTLRGAAWLLQIHGVADRVRAAAPTPGGLYFFDHPRRHIPADWPVQAPAPGWVAVERFEKDPGPIARIVRALGIAHLFPAPIARKLDPPPQTAVLYRVPPAPERPQP